MNPLTPSEVYECQVHLKKEFDKRRMDNKIESEKASKEVKSEKLFNSKPKSVSSTSAPNPKLLHSYEEEEEIEEIIRKPSSKGKSKITLFAGFRDVNRVLEDNGTLILLIYSESYFANDDLPFNLPVEIVGLLNRFQDFFPRSYLMGYLLHEG